MWNPAELSDLPTIIRRLHDVPAQLRRAPLGAPVADPAALAAVAARIDELAWPLEAAQAAARVAAAAGQDELVQRLGRAAQAADQALWQQVGAWMEMLGSLDDHRLARLLDDPAVAARRHALQAALRPPAEVAPHPHFVSLQQHLGPLLVAVGAPDSPGDTARSVTSWLTQHADRTAAAYHATVARHLQHGSLEQMVHAVAGVEVPALQNCLAAFEDGLAAAHAAAEHRSARMDVPLTVETRLQPLQAAVPAEQALATTRRAAALVDPRVTGALDEVLSRPGTVWIGDAPEAQCVVTPPGCPPFVAVPFDGSTRAASQVAHELFHAAHQRLLDPRNPLVARPVTAVAEAQAALGELLAADVGTPGDGRWTTRRADVVLAGVYKQVFSARLEVESFRHVAGGGVLTAAWLAERWSRSLASFHGPAWQPIAGDGHWWALDAHRWRRPGLLAAYATGAALAVAARHRLAASPVAGAAWVDLLTRGSTVPLARLRADAGLDDAAVHAGVATLGHTPTAWRTSDQRRADPA